MEDCKSERAAAAVAQIHIKRAAMVLSAAHDLTHLMMPLDRAKASIDVLAANKRAFEMALNSLGQASAAIEIQRKESAHV